jgi:phosphatidylserine/phosphatidylglycerophosphate/cardiolipin synthase-like enzyme
MADLFQPIVDPSTAGMSLVTPSSTVPTPQAGPAPRFAGEPLYWTRVNPNVAIHAFTRATIRVFTGTDSTIGSWTLYEVSPLPGVDYATFYNLKGGLPVQYVLVPLSTAMPPDQNAVLAGDVVTTPITAATFAVCFQDRISRDPALWAQEILDASGSASWMPFATALQPFPLPNLRLLDHVGHPLSTPPVNAFGVGAVTDGDSTLPASGSIPFATNVIAAGVQRETGVLGAPYALDSNERFVQLLNADEWFAQPPASSALPRWRTDSHVEPIVDGTPYFRRLVPDLRSAENHGSAWLAGWVFQKEALKEPADRWPLVPGDDTTQIVTLIRELNANQADVRMLVNQFVQVDGSQLAANAIPAFILAMSALIITLGFATDAIVDTAWIGLALTVATAGGILTVGPDPDTVLQFAKSAAEKSWDTFDGINQGLQAPIAFWSPNPVRVSDNALVNGGVLVLNGIPLAVLDHVGSYHQKLVVIKPAQGDPFGYLGGIDINSDRVDTPLHRAMAPFHDVQVRITGPAVADMAVTFRERFQHDTGTQLPAISASASGSHLVQIARTYPEVNGGPLTFAPNGESLIRDTLGKAIQAARDFIYIENQYFAPDDDLVHLLEDAGAGARGVGALVITLPTGTDQIFGDIRRDSVFGALANKWGARMHVGVPVRRFLDAPKELSDEKDLSEDKGRCKLVADLAKNDVQITLGPKDRVPVPPFWAFVDNELVRCDPPAANVTAPADSMVLSVRRSGSPDMWGAKPSDHTNGAPVLAVHIPGIYVHAKVMIVDDVFLSVGSTNIARRSFYHDGEINAFVVPQHLVRDRENPARRLRCLLWAEHLGLPPEIGLSLLADPLGSLPYFTRAWHDGCRWQRLYPTSTTDPSSALALPNYDLQIKTTGSDLSVLLNASPSVLGQADRPVIWNGIIDPTTALNSDAVAGPKYGP